MRLLGVNELVGYQRSSCLQVDQRKTKQVYLSAALEGDIDYRVHIGISFNTNIHHINSLG